MANKNLIQIVTYISPDLKALIDQERRNSGQRISMSAYVESLLRRHFERGMDGKARKGAA
jgi:hypothetical protein